MKRRDFIQQSSFVAGGILTKPSLVSNENTTDSNLIILATNWGFNGDMSSFCKAAKESMYNGIEVWVPNSVVEINKLRDLANAHSLQLGLLAGGSSSNFEEHRNQFFKALENAITLKPIYINCHSGRDYFTFEQNRELFLFANKLSHDTGIPIYHETHRGRALFAAHITKRFLESIPELKLTLDISHWCNVHESLLSDQTETINLALQHAEHIHARIGYAEGPQVNDPRSPEWSDAVKAHFGWWDKIIERKKKEGKNITILTEFGPADYMHTLPFTKQPVADQWGINVYMMAELRKRYGIK